MSDFLDFSVLPEEVREKLAELDLELSEALYATAAASMNLSEISFFFSLKSSQRHRLSFLEEVLSWRNEIVSM
ncbi:hypothetical protein DMENIID0001_020400 [Sergentomyia squamirostris]